MRERPSAAGRRDGRRRLLGSQLCDHLLACGHEVLAVDDLSTGSMRHLAQARGHARFEFVRADRVHERPAAVAQADRIFSLASPASPAYYQRKPVQTTLTSALGMWRVLDCVERSGARVLQASTSEVYGTPQVHPQPESYGAMSIRAARVPATTRASVAPRRFASAMRTSARWRSVAGRIARLFNCCGPRLQPGDGRVVSNFIVQALRGLPLTVYGDGLQTRSFGVVDHTVQALLH